MIGILVAVLLLGAFAVYAQPMIQAKIPATWTASTAGKIAIAGAMIFVAVLVVNLVARRTSVVAQV